MDRESTLEDSYFDKLINSIQSDDHPDLSHTPNPNLAAPERNGHSSKSKRHRTTADEDVCMLLCMYVCMLVFT